MPALHPRGATLGWAGDFPVGFLQAAFGCFCLGLLGGPLSHSVRSLSDMDFPFSPPTTPLFSEVLGAFPYFSVVSGFHF